MPSDKPDPGAHPVLTVSFYGCPLFSLEPHDLRAENEKRVRVFPFALLFDHIQLLSLRFLISPLFHFSHSTPSLTEVPIHFPP